MHVILRLQVALRIVFTLLQLDRDLVVAQKQTAVSMVHIRQTPPALKSVIVFQGLKTMEKFTHPSRKSIRHQPDPPLNFCTFFFLQITCDTTDAVRVY